MIVEEQNVVTLTYELRQDDTSGELLERMDANYPFVFLFGTGKLLPSFEQHLKGLAEGEQFRFTLSPEEAYGPIEAGNIIDVAMEAFRIEGAVPPNLILQGNFITLHDDEGIPHNGKILSWTEETVKVDFNHAMAGKHLYFQGTILNIRKATVDELIRQHYIQSDGIHGDDPQEDSLW